MRMRGVSVAAGAIALLAVSMWGPRAAEAGCCSCAWSASRSAANRVIHQVGGRIDRMEASIVETLQLQTAQLSGYIATGAKSTALALNAQTKLLAQIAREEAETVSKLQHRPTRSGCEAVTGMRGLRAGREVAAETAARAAAVEVARISGDKAIVARGGRDADASRRFRAWTTAHCNGDRALAGGDVCEGEASMHGADMRPGSLLDIRTFRDEREVNAAVEFGRNVAAPVVWDPIPLRAVDSPEDEQTALLLRSSEARSALAADWFARQRALRAPAADLGGWASALAPRGGVAGEISRYELLEILAAKRFEDPQWGVRLQEMTTDQLLRELLLSQAASLLVQWEQYRADERRGSMEAARLGIAAEGMRRLPGLADGLSVVQ